MERYITGQIVRDLVTGNRVMVTASFQNFFSTPIFIIDDETINGGVRYEWELSEVEDEA